MSFEKAFEHLKKYQLEDRVIVFPVLTSTVKEAANALGSKEGEIAKSLAFLVNDKAVLVIAAGDQKIDNAKFKMEFNVKAKMIAFNEVGNIIGHGAGGVCPFGVNEGVSVYLDESLKKYEIVYPACGSHNSAVKLTIEDIMKASEYIKWVNVCKDI
jgi:prolyl-tRNA editing enzyme YbaK/EbsC (Cys-tRNA(Pro) deacylase)